MTDDLLDTIQRIVREELRAQRSAELAVVEEQHPHAGESDKDNYACTVTLRDSGIQLKQVPVATPRSGAVSIPEVGDLVLVSFVGGDVNAPVIVGTLYNDADRPPVSDAGQAVLHLPLGAGDADAVHLEVSSADERKLVLKLGAGLELTLQDDDPVAAVSVDGGKATVDLARDGGVQVKSAAKLQVEAQGGIELKAPEIKIEADGQLTLKGGVVNIN